MNDRCYGLENILRSQKAVHKKQMKPVKWNGLEFESGAALARHLRLVNHYAISNYIKNKKPLKGYVPEFIKKDEYNEQNKTI